MPTTFSTRAENRDGIEILLVSGEIDLSTAPRLSQAIVSAATRDRPLVVDLTEVGFIDSSGVRAVTLADAASTDGAPLLLVPSEFVARVLEIACLEPAFRTYATLTDALDAARDFLV
jgi:anti-sigma B factor antagonist